MAVITEALLHCYGIGPARHKDLHSQGIRTWEDVIRLADRIPSGIRDCMVEECQRCLTALAADQIEYFVEAFAPQDRWRILHQYIEDISCFDLETTGLQIDSRITVITCWHRGELHTFVEHENLDDFLDLLDDVRLLVSFNGSSFDVPKLLDAFHIPELPCPHLDLRWVAWHRSYCGSLKEIADRLQISRPPDVEGTDGLMAVQLWDDWQRNKNTAARQQLIRYCGCDTLLLDLLARQVADLPSGSAESLWQHLPAAVETPIQTPPEEQRRRDLAARFGDASPLGLRTLGRTRRPKGRT